MMPAIKRGSPILALLLLTAGGAAAPPLEADIGQVAPNRQRVVKLFESMRQGKYKARDFPALEWSDVPALLDLADSRRVLKTFPKHPASNESQGGKCREGIVALWLIEGLRQGGDYPSLNPLCIDWQDPDRFSHENHDAFTRAYWAWWTKVQAQGRSKAADVDPLAGTTLEWY